MKCPNCKKLTYFRTNTGGRCTSCGYQGFTPANGGMGGKGQRCPHCGKYQVFNSKCRNCGTRFSLPKKA